jgi:hypothetical protein
VNRYQEIISIAERIAEQVCDDPEKVTPVAKDLIALVAVMMSTVGEIIRDDARSDMGYEQATGDGETGYARYLMGDAMRDTAEHTRKRSVLAGGSSCSAKHHGDDCPEGCCC